jgi:hypothetical protein
MNPRFLVPPLKVSPKKSIALDKESHITQHSPTKPQPNRIQAATELHTYYHQTTRQECYKRVAGIGLFNDDNKYEDVPECCWCE